MEKSEDLQIRRGLVADPRTAPESWQFMISPKSGYGIGRAPKAVRASGPPSWGHAGMLAGGHGGHGDMGTRGHVDMGTRGHGGTRGHVDTGTWARGGTPRDVTPLPLRGKTLHGGMWTHRHVDRKLREAWSSRDAPDMAPYPRLSYTQAATAPASPFF